GVTIGATAPTTISVSARATVSSITEKPSLRLRTSRRPSTNRDEVRAAGHARRRRRRALIGRRDDDLNDERAGRRRGQRRDRPPTDESADHIEAAVDVGRERAGRRLRNAGVA